MEFKIRTIDNAYSYTSTIPVGISMDMGNNSGKSDTQGFLRKVQKGQNRYSIEIVMKITDKILQNTMIPMLDYNDDVYIVLDRNMPGRGTTDGTFTFEDLKILQEFYSGGSWEYEIKMKFIEKIYNQGKL